MVEGIAKHPGKSAINRNTRSFISARLTRAELMKTGRYIVNSVKSRFAKNLAIVMSGTAVAQIIGFALTPVISRLFTPDDFGVFGTFTSVLNVIAAGVTLQYSQAVMLPKEDTSAANTFAVSILAVFFVSLACLIVSFVFSERLLDLLKVPESQWLVWMLPAGICVHGINQSFQAWTVRRKEFKKTASSQVIRAGCANSLQILAGFLGLGNSGLIASSVAANGCASLGLAHQVVKDKSLIKNSLSWRQIKFHAKEYRDFPIYSATQNVMNALSQGLPVLLLAHFYGIAVAGAYAFGIRILQAPMNFVLTALRQVLFQKASETFNQGGRLLPLFIKITSGLLAVVFFPALVLFIWAPQIFPWIFGAEWQAAGTYARWLVLWLVPLFSNVPSVLIARILRQQRKIFFFEVIVLITRISMLAIGGFYFSAIHTIILFSVAGFLLNMMYITWVGGLLVKRE